jgi:coenzyme F420 hydrogenase subunit beta
MPLITIDGIEIEAEEHWTILDTCTFLGLEIPTLCHHEGLRPWGGCRLCMVEIGEGENAKLVSSCTYPVEEGLVVRTSTGRVVRARKVIMELLVALCPQSRVLQDMAADMGVNQVRFKPQWKDCVYCGLCVRICEEQMAASAIGFAGRGQDTKITTPFDKTSDQCRQCGGCIYICPACQLRCPGFEHTDALCGGCLHFEPTCINEYDQFMCYMGTTGDCGACIGNPATAESPGSSAPSKEKSESEKE